MRALIADPGAPSGLRLGETEDPRPGPGEALIRVAATSLNHGESKRVGEKPAGTVIGWDLAGLVEAAAADGSGPPAGSRVAGLVKSGAWAELAAVPTSRLAEIPAALTDAEAATVPLAGLTAVGAVRLGGDVAGRRVLVTGASGGLGRFEIQLARRAGATVTALTGRRERAASLAQLGAEVAIGEPAPGAEFDLILEGVGGSVLAAALESWVAPGGTIVSLGIASKQLTTFRADDFYMGAPGARTVAYTVWWDLERRDEGQADLRELLRAAGDGSLRAEVAAEFGWREADAAIRALLDREVGGKVVLRMD